MINQDEDGPVLQATNKTSTELSSKSCFDENGMDHDDVKVIDLANDEVTNTEEQKIKDIWSKNAPQNIVPPPSSQPKVVFVKCKVCLKKVRKDMIERHKRVRHALPRVAEEKVTVNSNHQTPNPLNQPNQANHQTPNLPNQANHQNGTTNNLASTEVKADKQVKKELPYENEIKEGESEIKSGPLNKTDYCTICHKQFKLRKYLMKHMSQIHRESEKPDPKRIKTEEFEFKCSECSQTFTSKFYLSKHLLRNHGKHDLTVYCKLCKQEFKFARYLKRHKKSVHSEEMHFFDKDTGDLEEPFKCPECNETFVTEKIAKYHQLRKHVNTKGEKRHRTVPSIKTERLPCKLCKHDFRIKKYLDRHKQSVHADELHFFEKEEVDQEEKFPCTICSEAFITENSLKYHKSKKHEEKKQDPNNTCDLCSKVFKENKYLRTHKEVSHSGGSNASAQIDLDTRNCKLCGTQFSEKSSAWNMRRHMLRMHSGTK